MLQSEWTTPCLVELSPRLGEEQTSAFKQFITTTVCHA